MTLQEKLNYKMIDCQLQILTVKNYNVRNIRKGINKIYEDIDNICNINDRDIISINENRIRNKIELAIFTKNYSINYTVNIIDSKTLSLDRITFLYN